MDYYNVDIEIQYHDNLSYRNMLRKLFNMKINYNPALDDIDEETRESVLGQISSFTPEVPMRGQDM